MSRLTVIAVLVVVAGCGGDDGRLSKAEFVERADEICARADARTDAIAPPRDASLAEAARFIDENVAVQRPAVEELDRLRPPEEDILARARAYGLQKCSESD